MFKSFRIYTHKTKYIKRSERIFISHLLMLSSRMLKYACHKSKNGSVLIR